MAEVLSACAQWPLLPYKAPSSKPELEELQPFSFEPSFSTDNFDFETTLLEFDFDAAALLDATSLDATSQDGAFGDDGDFFIPNDFGDFGIVPSASSCSLASNCSAASTAMETEGFPYNVPTGARSRRAHSGSRKHSCPSHLQEAALQLPVTAGASRLSRTGGDSSSLMEEAAEQLPACDALLFGSDCVPDEAAVQLHAHLSYDECPILREAAQQLPDEAARQLLPPHDRSGPVLAGGVIAAQSVGQIPHTHTGADSSPAAAEAAQQLPAYQSSMGRVSSTIIVQSRPVDTVLAPIEPVARPSWPAFGVSIVGMTRQQRVQRYREKRKRRTFEKTIRYEARRAYAEVRPRIKGRFATKEEAAAIRAAQVSGGPHEF